MAKRHVAVGLERIDTAASLLAGRRVGLMTNQTGVDHGFRSAVERIRTGYRLSALFACEHGIRGDLEAGAEVSAHRDPETGVTVYSVYSGAGRTLTEEMLGSFDVFVYDIQDAGARFYTYLYSLANAMAACARAGKPVLVLDRPNPLGGAKAAGTVIERGFESFVGNYALPTRYGLTVAEYARHVREHLRLDLELHWARMRGWRRGLYLDDTDLPWVPPSPNLPTAASVLCYWGACVFEGTNLSEGRGTPLPFEQIGAPWVDAARLEARLNALALPGVLFRRTAFTPCAGKHRGEGCRGVQLHVTDRDRFDAFEAGLLLLEAIRDLHGDRFRFLDPAPGETAPIDRLLGTDSFRKGTLTARGLIEAHAPRVLAFREASKAHWLYPQEGR